MNIKKTISEKIKKNEIKMKPKWLFGLKKLGILLSLASAVMVASICLTIVIFLIEIGVSMDLLEFGELGRRMFFEGLPWLWMGIFGVSLAGGLVLFSKNGLNYRQEAWVKLLKLTIVIIVLLAILLIVRSWFEIDLLIKLI